MFDTESLRGFRAGKYTKDQLTPDGLYRLDHNTSEEQRRMHFLLGLFPPRLHKKINSVLNDHKELISDFVRNIPGFEASNEGKLAMEIGAFGVGVNNKTTTDPNTLVESLVIIVGQPVDNRHWKPIIALTYNTNPSHPSIKLEKEGKTVKFGVDDLPTFMASLVELSQGLSTYMPELRQSPNRNY